MIIYMRILILTLNLDNCRDFPDFALWTSQGTFSILLSNPKLFLVTEKRFL